MKAVKISGKIIMLVSFVLVIVSLFQGRGIIVAASFAMGILFGLVIYVFGYVKTWLG